MPPVSPSYLEPGNLCKHIVLAEKWRNAGAVVPTQPWIQCSECLKPVHVKTLEQTFPTDVIVETTHPVDLMEAAVRWLFTQWGDAVVSNSSATVVWCAQNHHMLPYSLNEELFVYKNVGEFAADEDANPMNFIHLLRGGGKLTVVRANDSKEGFALVDVLKSTKFPSS